MNGEMKCMPMDMPTERLATIAELQMEGRALANKATEMVKIISVTMYGIDLPDEKMDDPRNLRDALVQENNVLGNLCRELDRIARDLGCR